METLKTVGLPSKKGFSNGNVCLKIYDKICFEKQS